MTDQTESPTTHRTIQTKSGIVTIPREQKGVPLKEYFRNAELPADVDRAVVYATANGPVLSRPDPVPWNEAHAEKARYFAGQIKSLIDEKGYYSKSLSMYAGRLADETGYARDEMKAVIVKSFTQEHGKDPFIYLQDQRQAQGLPVSDPQGPDYSPEQ